MFKANTLKNKELAGHSQIYWQSSPWF